MYRRGSEAEAVDDPDNTYRRGSTAEADEIPGGPMRFSSALISALDIAASAMILRAHCESPIEVFLGSQLMADLNIDVCAQEDLGKISPNTVVLVPQYWLDRFRFDFAVYWDEKPLLLIECDGREFHSTPEQIQRDAMKNKRCLALGIPLLRFAGKEIHYNTRFCSEQCMACIRGALS